MSIFLCKLSIKIYLVSRMKTSLEESKTYKKKLKRSSQRSNLNEFSFSKKNTYHSK